MGQLFQYELVGTTEERILTAMPERTSLILYNNHGTQTIYYRRTKGVSSVNGFPLPAGASISFKIPEDDVTGELWAIGSGADTDLRFIEGFGIIPRSWR